MKNESGYLHALEQIMGQGEDVDDRTGTGARMLFGMQMRFNLLEGFPAVTTKKLAWKSVVSELLWFLEGSTDERRLAEIRWQDHRENIQQRETIWTANANKQAVELGYENTTDCRQLGPVYGKQWRDFGGVDQISWIIDRINTQPNCRRIIMSSWNPPEIPVMALPPCHVMAQFRVINNRLSCQLYQRSADMFLGVPFNIASYALLTHVIANITDYDVGEFIWTGGDCHIYYDHFDVVDQQLSREPRPMPTLSMPDIESLTHLLTMNINDFQLENYTPHEKLSANMAV